MNTLAWPYPGSRWWKFDFHTHTPASKDTRAWQQAIGKPDEVTPEKWLLEYMQAEIDCVVVTDHNSGAWIDKLKTAYQQMRISTVEGFREITIFPGVELSVNGGVHILAVFDPSAGTGDIDGLLGAVGYTGTKGDSDGVTSKSLKQVIEIVLRLGAIPIPAHADKDKGILQCVPNSNRAVQDANTIKAALTVEGLLAIEWCDDSSSIPECAKHEFKRLARVLGSDCHNFRNHNVPGSAYTWVKMASPPSLEGLRLALMDGGQFSLHRSTSGDIDPFHIPDQIITSLTIKTARLMGRSKPESFRFSPYFNAIVGGRGTGKSTVINTLRLAARREQELQQLGDNSGPLVSFKSFSKVGGDGSVEGALLPETEIELEWLQDTTKTRLRWKRNDTNPQVEEWQQGQWQEASSQSINAQRFPVRIFSQGQIASLAGEGRQSLLTIIDQAAGIEPAQDLLQEACRTYLVQAAQLREMQGRLGDKSEIQRQLDKARLKVQAFQQSDYSDVLSAYSQGRHQAREVELVFSQLSNKSSKLNQLVEELYIDDWPKQYFENDSDAILSWRSNVDAQLEKLREVLKAEAVKLDKLQEQSKQSELFTSWQAQVQAAKAEHNKLQEQLAAQGIDDPKSYAIQTVLIQQLEAKIKEIKQLESDCQKQKKTLDNQYKLILQRRHAITQLRSEFLQNTLYENQHVRIQVTPFGNNSNYLERQLRELLELQDTRFSNDIAQYDENNNLTGGLTLIMRNNQGLDGVEQVKNILRAGATELSKGFQSYLDRKFTQSDLADHIKLWFPEDDLQIEYQRSNRWNPIDSGSQGQRSAAMLAFLLAFGKEPIILDQPEDDLDNQLIYELIVKQIKENKIYRQLIIVTHNPNIVVNGDADLVHVMGFAGGQCVVSESGALQQSKVREAVCNVMEGGHEAFSRRWQRLGGNI